MDSRSFPRRASVERKTKETSIRLELCLDGGPVDIKVPVGFFGHMLEALSVYAGWGMTLRVEGDTHVDHHHTVEDTGLALGEALCLSLGDFSSHRRFSSALVPMDDALAEVALDAGRRPFLVFEARFPQPLTLDFDFCLVEEFLRALVNKAGFTLHVEGKRGANSHHLAEAIFKALGMALKEALSPRGGPGGPLSTKGVL